MRKGRNNGFVGTSRSEMREVDGVSRLEAKEGQEPRYTS
jgi:hypothetical protein